jgi:hypothetical protein
MLSAATVPVVRGNTLKRQNIEISTTAGPVEFSALEDF